MPTVTRARRPVKVIRRRVSKDTHWRTAYGTRDYVVAGMEYDDYEPAYRLGVEMADRHGHKKFAEVEPALADEWLAAQGKSRLSWQQARPAVREGYAGVVRVPVGKSRTGRTAKRAGATVRKGASTGSARVRPKTTGKAAGRSTARSRTAAARKDDLTKRRPQDAARINVNEPWEVDYWCGKLGTTPGQLRQAVKKVGVMAKDVRRHLNK